MVEKRLKKNRMAFMMISNWEKHIGLLFYVYKWIHVGLCDINICDEKTVIASSVVTGEYVSDHCAVLCKIQIEKPKAH